MVAHFIRLLYGGAVTFFLSMLVQYTVVVYVPGGVLTQMIAQNPTVPEADRPAHVSYYRVRLSWYDDPLAEQLHIRYRWPERYLRWLFDPDASSVYDRERNEYIQPGIDWNVLGVRIKGSGVLTGYFGKSRWLAPITPVSEVIGPGYPLVFALLLALICTFMYIATVQRIDRPAPYITRQQSGTLASKSHLFDDPVGRALLERAARA